MKLCVMKHRFTFFAFIHDQNVWISTGIVFVY